jgi:hypothetical protein
MADAPSPEHTAAWRRLIETQAQVVERVEAALAPVVDALRAAPQPAR